MAEGLLQLIIICLVLGAILYVVQGLTIDATIKMIVKVVVVVALCIVLLRFAWPFVAAGL